jgi:hypothetical protein
MSLKQVLVPLSVVAMLLSFAVAPGVASASSSAQNAYSEAAPLNEVGGSTNDTEPAGDSASSEPTSTTESSSVLPFTGLDLAILGLLGVGLLGIGLMVRRASRSTSA